MEIQKKKEDIPILVYSGDNKKTREKLNEHSGKLKNKK